MRNILLSFTLLAIGSAAIPSNWRTTCGNTERQSILSLISMDIIARHINSGAFDTNQTTCSNFHRHVCPKTIAKTTLFQELFDQVVAIERGCTKYDVYPKLENDLNFAATYDTGNYTDKTYLSNRLFLMPRSVLIRVYEYTTLHKAEGHKFYNNLWYTRNWTTAFDQATFPAKYDLTIFINPLKRQAFVDTLATDIITIVNAALGVTAMKTMYLPMLKDYSDMYHLLNVLYREGYETGANRDRLHEVILNGVKEYSEVLEDAAWSSVTSGNKTRYDRFSDFVYDIYNKTLKSTLNTIGTQEASLSLAKDFYDFYLEEKAMLAPLIVLPYLRTFIAISRAQQRAHAKIDLDLAIRWKIVNKGVPNVVSGYYTYVLMKNQAMFDIIAMTSPTSAVYGVIGYTYIHEMYHGIQWQYADFMPNSPVVSTSSSCSFDFYTTVAARFTGDYRWTGWPQEEEADIYGTQIAYKAFVRKIGNQIDEIAYPNTTMTHRQLFFYANSIYGCNVHTAIWGTPYIVVPDSHYKVNGAITQIPDFKTTFSCSDTDQMIFTGSQQCITFFGNLSN